MQLFIRTIRGWILRILAVKVYDRGIVHTHYIFEDFDAKTGQLVNHQEFDHNCLLKEGITALLNLLIGAAETAFNNANTCIGVGDDDTAADDDQTGLQAVTNKFYKEMDAGYPTVAGQIVTFRTTFLEAEANFAWKEITIINGDDDTHDNLNRKVQAMGMKTNAVSRVTTVELSIT
jgi:hypothetical protein